MKKTIMIIIMFTFLIVLTACSNAGTNSDSGESSLENKEQQEDATTDTDSDEEDESTGKEESSGVFEVKEDDQPGLGLGDTGSFDTLFGTYEVTLSSAKLEDEINGEI